MCVQRAYNGLRVPLTEKLKSSIDDSMLIIENNKLIKGAHFCGLCDELYCFRYRLNPNTDSINFMNDLFKKYIRRKHKVQKKTLNLKKIK